MINLLYVKEGLVSFFHSFIFLISNLCYIYRVKIFKLTVQFSIPYLKLFVVGALLFIRFLMHFSNVFTSLYRTSFKSSRKKYAVAVNFAVLFENISTTIKHILYDPWLQQHMAHSLYCWLKNLKF